MTIKALAMSGGVATALYFGMGFTGIPLAIFSLFFFLGFGGLATLRTAYRTGGRDAKSIVTLLKLLRSMRQYKNKTVSDLFTECAIRNPNKTAILFEDTSLTFRELDRYSNQIANFFESIGITRGDTVALFMTNCPQYVAIMLGLSKLGAKTSFINFNLRDKALHHSISICHPSAIVYDLDLSDAVGGIQEQLNEDLQKKSYCVGGEPTLFHSQSFDAAVSSVPDNPPPPLIGATSDDWLCFIYTSGTTGLPKAVPIRHQRFISMANSLGTFANISSSDILYVTLPLYHTNGGILGVGQMVIKGCTIAIRRKFSASQYWTDCIKYRCTVVQYIGEVCRYLLCQPVRPQDKQHCVRLATGNGLRPQIWGEFQKRFNIELIAEFYGSTEGNCSLINNTGRVGACGFKSVLFPTVIPIYLLKVVQETGELVKDSNGFYVESPVGEPGELVALVKDNFLRRFDGYENKEATNKKILTNVFKHGDKYFRSGDILKLDQDGFFYFTDRTGDTFRWKGENVSTTEVEGIIAKIYKNQTDVVVFGVEVPNTEGKAGMAIIRGTPESTRITGLAEELIPVLPNYAIPVFVRLVLETKLTGTFKFQKSDYKKDGYSVDCVSDPLYILDSKLKKYIPLDQRKYEDVQNGECRL